MNFDSVSSCFINLLLSPFEEILELVSQDKIRYRETITKGFKNAPQALRDVLTGKNFGKQIIEI